MIVRMRSGTLNSCTIEEDEPDIRRFDIFLLDFHTVKVPDCVVERTRLAYDHCRLNSLDEPHARAV